MHAKLLRDLGDVFCGVYFYGVLGSAVRGVDNAILNS